MSPEVAIVLPAGLAASAGILALALEAFASSRLAVWIAGFGLLAAGTAAAAAALTSDPAPVWAFGPDAEMLVAGSGYSAIPAVVFLSAGVAVSGGAATLRRRPGGGATAALIALASLGAATVAASHDLVLTLLSFETTALCGYALVAGARSPAADGASIRYFVQGAVATGILVLGIAVAMGSGMGSTSIVSVPPSLGTELSSVLLAGIMLLLAAYAFKAGAFPFHSWAPDAYEVAPAESASFLASGPKAGAITALVILLAIPAANTALTGPTATVLAVLATASIVFGNLVALRQSSYRRMLAYSGIAQVGYALVGLAGALGIEWPLLSRASAVFFIATYAIASAGAFLGAEAVQRLRPSWDGTIAGLAGLGRQRPMLGVSLAALMFSLAGIPPFLGFWGKLLVFTSAVQGGYTWLAVVGVLGSVVSFAFYGSVLRHVFFEEPTGSSLDRSRRDARVAELWVAAIALAITVGGTALVWTDLAAVLGRFAV